MIKMLSYERAIKIASVAALLAGIAQNRVAAAAAIEAPVATVIDKGSAVAAGITKILIATVLLLVTLWLVRCLRLCVSAKLEHLASLPGGFPASLVSDLRAHILQAVRMLARLLATGRQFDAGLHLVCLLPESVFIHCVLGSEIGRLSG